MGLETKLEKLAADLENEAVALEEQSAAWASVFPAYLHNWVQGILMMKVNEKRDVITRIEALLE